MDTPEFEDRVPTRALTLYQTLCDQAGPVYKAQINDPDFQAQLARTVMKKALDRIESLETLSMERGDENERLRRENYLLGRWRFLHPGLSLRERAEAARWLGGAIRRRLGQRGQHAPDPQAGHPLSRDPSHPILLESHVASGQSNCSSYGTTL
ncbi:hypothetical protein BH11ARM2_BH11ARM2_23500 [soil metagenome]